MKRYIFFLVFLLVGIGASAQQSVNDSLKNEPLFKSLVRLKGKVLKEIDMINKTIDPDSIKYCREYLKALCDVGMMVIDYPGIYADQLVRILDDPNERQTYYSRRSRWGEAPGTLLESLRNISDATKHLTDDDMKQKLRQLVPGLREAMIIY